jgi:hypothetical protein
VLVERRDGETLTRFSPDVSLTEEYEDVMRDHAAVARGAKLL